LLVRFKKILLGVVLTISTLSFQVRANEEMDQEEGDASDVGRQIANYDQAVTRSDFEGTWEDRPLYVEHPDGEIDGHQFIAENETIELYLEPLSLSIIIRDKATSAVMYATVDEPDDRNNQIWQDFMKSGVTLEYLTSNNVNATRLSTLTEGTRIELDIHENGFLATVYYEDLQLGYTLSVELSQKRMVAEILEDSLIETGENKISGFYVFPYLGYAQLGNREGYMLIPDGSGALIHLQDHEGEYNQPFSNYIFGDNLGVSEGNIPTLLRNRNVIKDAENIVMPIFGMVHTDSQIGVLGIVEGDAQFSTLIEAYPNGAITIYDWITAKFVYRQSYTQPLSQGGGSIQTIQSTRNSFDVRVRYEFVTEEKANYTGLASTYRHYLLDEGYLTPREDEFKLRLDFLGLEQEKGMIFNRDVVMTTVEDINLIYEELNDQGVDQLLSIYKGWQRDGLTAGSLVRNFQTDSAIGGNRALLNLLSDLETKPIDFYLYQDPLRLNASSYSLLQFSTVRQITRRVYEDRVYAPVVDTFHYLQPAKIQDLLEKLASQYLAKDVEHVMFSGISNTLFSHTVSGELRDRTRTATDFSNIAASYDEVFDLLLEQPFSYLWSYTSAYMDIPLKGSNYIFVDEDVPFLALVLKGVMPLYSHYINFEANQQETFLQLIEQGVRPSFFATMEDPVHLKNTNSQHIYTSRYDLYQDEIIAYYHEFKRIHDQTMDATIEKHERIGQVTKVVYSNGFVIYLNYSSQAQTIEGVTIEPMSYELGEKR